jgi:hypothetical protein
MSDVTQVLSQIESGDPSASEELLPLVYKELRKLAAAKLAQEKLGQTLQATAHMHEAYIRLVDVNQAHGRARGRIRERLAIRSGIQAALRCDSRRRGRANAVSTRRPLKSHDQSCGTHSFFRNCVGAARSSQHAS